ncbi:MAG TPA: hypothetical protein VGL34_07100, partial [Steroidobacteraceae bacterium]
MPDREIFGQLPFADQKIPVRFQEAAQQRPFAQQGLVRDFDDLATRRLIADQQAGFNQHVHERHRRGRNFRRQRDPAGEFAGFVDPREIWHESPMQQGFKLLFIAGDDFARPRQCFVHGCGKGASHPA